MHEVQVKPLQRFFSKRGSLPDFCKVLDPRSRRGRRWEAQALLMATYCSMLTGAVNFRDAEAFTARLGPLRRRLGIGRRVPDSTLARFFSVLRDEQGLRDVLVRQVRAAERRKALEPVGLPINIVAIDGKTLYYGPVEPDDEAAQKSEHDFGDRYRIHTLHAVLVTASSQPCIDQCLVPGDTNEQGAVIDFIRQLSETYGRSNRLECLSFDAGFAASETAASVHGQGLAYIISIKDNQPTLLAELKRLCGWGKHKQAGHKAVWASPWERYRGALIRRELFRSTDLQRWPGWQSVRQVWRIKQTVRKGDEVTVTNKYFVTNLAPAKLRPAQAVQAIRLHWGVENACHWTADVIMGEDKHPWCTKNKAIRLLSWLRLLALNTLAFIRCRYLRRRQPIPWRRLLECMALAFCWVTPPQTRRATELLPVGL